MKSQQQQQSRGGGGGTGTSASATGARDVPLSLPIPSNNNHQQQQQQRQKSSVIDDDADDGALDESEQTNRPIDDAIHQQRVQAWHPTLDPTWVIIALFYLGVIFVPTGFKINSIQENIVEMKAKYDDSNNYIYEEGSNNKVVLSDNNTCGIGNQFNANKTCFVTFTVPKLMNPPILIYYEISHFHQNHRMYFKSRDPYQLYGITGKQDTIAAQDCQPLNKLGNITLNPCGLIANTLFNDYFTLLPGSVDIFNEPLIVNEDGITWYSDILYKYRQPDGFNFSQCPDGTCDASCCAQNDSCTVPYYNKKDGKCYRFYYPNDDTTQYLYETYPDIISPIEGVLNEHFMVWMRIAALPQFRKLYAWIDQPIAAGTNLTFQINANFVVTRFKGSKTLVITSTSIFGGSNPYVKDIFINVGYYCLIVGTLFALKHFIRPRKYGDPKYLHYKED